MLLTALKSKLHRATVTDANLEYEGSVTVDATLLELADIQEHERVEIYNVTNGQRLATYAIKGPPNSGVICINGAGAHLVSPGHLVIIAAYVSLEPHEMKQHQPRVILLDSENRPKQMMA